MSTHRLLLLVVFVGSSAADTAPQAGSGVPLKYIASCEIDLDVDGEVDVVMLVETLKGRELIALMRRPSGYDAYIVSRDKPDMHLSCHFGKYIEARTSRRVKGTVYETPGTYIKLTLPEGSAVAYFWIPGGFKEVWVSD